jgi:hypothetical protein
MNLTEQTVAILTWVQKGRASMPLVCGGCVQDGSALVEADPLIAVARCEVVSQDGSGRAREMVSRDLLGAEGESAKSITESVKGILVAAHSIRWFVCRGLCLGRDPLSGLKNYTFYQTRPFCNARLRKLTPSYPAGDSATSSASCLMGETWPSLTEGGICVMSNDQSGRPSEMASQGVPALNGTKRGPQSLQQSFWYSMANKASGRYFLVTANPFLVLDRRGQFVWEEKIWDDNF